MSLKRKKYNYSDYSELSFPIHRYKYFSLEIILEDCNLFKKDSEILQSYIDLYDDEIDDNSNSINFHILSKRENLSSEILIKHKKSLNFEYISLVNKNIDLFEFRNYIYWDKYLELHTLITTDNALYAYIDSIYHYFINNKILETCDNMHYKIWTSLIDNIDFIDFFIKYIVNLNKWEILREKLVNAYDIAIRKNVFNSINDWNINASYIVDDMIDILLENDQSNKISTLLKKIKL